LIGSQRAIETFLQSGAAPDRARSGWRKRGEPFISRNYEKIIRRLFPRECVIIFAAKCQDRTRYVSAGILQRANSGNSFFAGWE